MPSSCAERNVAFVRTAVAAPLGAARDAMTVAMSLPFHLSMSRMDHFNFYSNVRFRRLNGLRHFGTHPLA